MQFCNTSLREQGQRNVSLNHYNVVVWVAERFSKWGAQMQKTIDIIGIQDFWGLEVCNGFGIFWGAESKNRICFCPSSQD